MIELWQKNRNSLAAIIKGLKHVTFPYNPAVEKNQHCRKIVTNRLYDACELTNENKTMNTHIETAEIHVCHPVASISVNKNHVVFDDKEGTKDVTLANAKEVRQFLNYLRTQATF